MQKQKSAILRFVNINQPSNTNAHNINETTADRISIFRGTDTILEQGSNNETEPIQIIAGIETNDSNEIVALSKSDHIYVYDLSSWPLCLQKIEWKIFIYKINCPQI